MEKYKNILNKELGDLEAQLKTVGRKNPSNQEDWESQEINQDVDRADETEVAESIQQHENNNAVLNQLEVRLNEVKLALEKIENGSFGKCGVCEMDIEEDRLEVNPAAPTCKAHMSQ